MRLVKLSILAALLAIASSALIGSTASATTTELCKGHEGLACSSNRVSTTHLVSATGTIVELLGAIGILCLSTLVETGALAGASPQSIHTFSLTFTGCGTGSSHNNCTATVEELPLFDLLKTGLDEGVLTASSGQVQLQCSNLGLDCLYDVAGMEFAAGGGHLTANETEVTELGGKFLCPDESTLDSLLEALESAYILQPGGGTALCKTHTAEKCPDNDLIKAVHFVAKTPIWDFEKGKHKVKCEESTLKGTVEALRGAQETKVTELTWEGCKRNEEENCTVTTENDIFLTSWEKLNVGLIGFYPWTKVECGKIINCEVNHPVMKLEGAGAHNGKITPHPLNAFSEGAPCPQPIAFSATYESVTDKVYVLK
jgi:hypothetical protein